MNCQSKGPRSLTDLRIGGDPYLALSIRAVIKLLFFYLFLQSVANAEQIPRAALQYRNDIIRHTRAVWGLDGPVASIAAQIHQESAFNANAHSIYAEGLSEFTPATAKWISNLYHNQLGEPQPYNPQWALRALNLYDQYLYDGIKLFDSSCDRYLFMLSSYNGGDGWRRKRQRMSIHPGNYPVTSLYNPGIKPTFQRENEEYPKKIIYKHQPLYLSWGQGVCN